MLSLLLIYVRYLTLVTTPTLPKQDFKIALAKTSMREPSPVTIANPRRAWNDGRSYKCSHRERMGSSSIIYFRCTFVRVADS
jgi:hypothetical protein